MAEYYVSWAVDIEADSAEEAALKAKEMHLNPDSTANVFTVSSEVQEPIEIDLDDEIDGDLLLSSIMPRLKE